MKKIIALVISVITMLRIMSITNASNVVGKTVYTDIIASINDYNIASFNINGYTGIVAEDLRNYGFKVLWNAEERALYITRDNTNIVQSTYIAPEIPKSRIGVKAYDLYQTDIKTYINGKLVPSYNINGQTIIHFDNLEVFGKVSYEDSIRRLDLDIEGLNYKISPPYKHYPSLPNGLFFEKNYVDGIQVRWFATNNTNKTINYYTTTYYMFNPVGDFAYDIMGNASFSIRTVGPVLPGELILDFTSEYEIDAYSKLCDGILLSTIELEYSDGTYEKIYYGHIGFEETAN